MQNYLREWQTLSREDIFSFWRNEARLKKALRQKPDGYRNLQIQTGDQYVLLRQSLAYGEYQPVFMQIVFYNIDNQVVQNELLHGSKLLYKEFLLYLPQAISREKSSPRNLQFLINLYRDDYADCYTEILAVLNEEECDYLLKKTANPGLRKQLKARTIKLQQKDSANHHGLLQNTETADYPTLYGDKVNLLIDAARSLSPNPPLTAENLCFDLSAYLQIAEQLFTLGMLNECLALLQLVYQHWGAGRENLHAEDNSQLYRLLSRSLAKSLSIYALLASSCPDKLCQELYQQYFPEIACDNNAQIYLNIQQNLLINRSGNPQYSLLEMKHLFLPLAADNDDLLATCLVSDMPINENIWQQLLDIIERDLTIMPHRAFISMEILRFLAHQHKILISKTSACRLMQNYLTLYKWIPAAPLFNRDIYAQLAPLTDYELQKEVNQLWSIANQYTRQSIQDLYFNQPEHFKTNNNLRQLLLGSFLGVN